MWDYSQNHLIELWLLFNLTYSRHQEDNLILELFVFLAYAFWKLCLWRYLSKFIAKMILRRA